MFKAREKRKKEVPKTRYETEVSVLRWDRMEFKVHRNQEVHESKCTWMKSKKECFEGIGDSGLREGG